MTRFPQDVSVVVVAHNASSCLPTTMESLHKAGCPAPQITVVDVASTDGGPDWLATQWPEVRVLRLDSNDGPGPARNLGIIDAKTPYVLLMDADVMVEPDTVPQLRSAMAKDPSVAIGSPIVVYASRPNTIQYAGTGLHFICEAVNPWQDRSVSERGSDMREIGCASTCALLVARTAAIRVGLFDQRYFKCKEDGDFTHRINLAGFKILEVPEARVHHNGRPRGTDLFYYQLRSRWHFMLKNYQLRTLVLLTPVLLLHELLQLGLLVYTGHGITYVKAILGLVRMLPSLRDDRAEVAGFRVRQDYEVLVSSPIVVREDLLRNSLFHKAKILHERILALYWHLLTKAVLHR